MARRYTWCVHYTLTPDVVISLSRGRNTVSSSKVVMPDSSAANDQAYILTYVPA